MFGMCAFPCVFRRVGGLGGAGVGFRRGGLDIEEEGKERAMYVRKGKVCFSLCCPGVGGEGGAGGGGGGGWLDMEEEG